MILFFISLTQVRIKNSFLEQIMTIYKPIGRRENYNDIYNGALSRVNGAPWVKKKLVSYPFEKIWL